MSLTIFTRRDKVPANLQIIDNNDLYFIGYSNIPDDAVTVKILSSVDGVERVSNTLFDSKFIKDAALSKDMLSTGAKTLLNITQHSDKCFNTVECGENALICLKDLHSGYALVEVCCVSFVGDSSCDLIIDGKLFTDFNEATDYMYHGGESG